MPKPDELRELLGLGRDVSREIPEEHKAITVQTGTPREPPPPLESINALRALGDEARLILEDKLHSMPETFTKRELMDLAKLGLVDTMPRPTGLDAFGSGKTAIHIHFVKPAPSYMPVAEPDAVDVIEVEEP